MTKQNAQTLCNKQSVMMQAAQAKRMMPFRIHYIYQLKETPNFWQSSMSFTMARPNNLARKGAIVEVLQ